MGRVIFRTGQSFILIFLCGFMHSAFAVEDARLLPAGISRIRFAGARIKTVVNKFDNNGELASLGGANQTIKLSDISAKNRDMARLVEGLNNIQPGLGSNLFNGNIYQDTSMQQNIFGAAFEYGLSKRWNIGIRLRAVERHFKTTFRMENTNNAQNLAKSLRTNAVLTPELQRALNTVANFDDTNFWTKTFFTDRGYEAPTDFSKVDLGYTEIGAKYLIFGGDRLISSLQAGFRAPTGQDESLKNPFDLGTGGNVWGVGLQSIDEWIVASFLSLGASAKYEYYFADTKLRAVRKDANDMMLPSLLPGDGQVQSVQRNMGGKFDGEVSTTVRIPGDAVTVWSAYQYTQKAKDKFAGPGDLYYAGLSQNTDYRSRNAEFGVEYSTISSYRKGAFFLPMQVSFLYNTTLSGMNTPNASYGRVDLKVYF